MSPTGSRNRTRPTNSSTLGAAIVRGFGSIDALIAQVRLMKLPDETMSSSTNTRAQFD